MAARSRTGPLKTAQHFTQLNLVLLGILDKENISADSAKYLALTQIIQNHFNSLYSHACEFHFEDAMAGQRVLVTGASKGIGRAIMRRLHNDGYRVTGLARSRPNDLANGEEFYCCDLADLDKARALVSELASVAPFYGLINNVAAASTTSLEQTSPRDIQAAAHMILGTALVCTQAVLPGMRAARTGRIINLSSRAALGKADRTAYSACKAGVIGMTKTWALELASQHITVNAIAPGPIATDAFRATNQPNDPRTKSLLAAIPLLRIGMPEEIAHAAAYLLDRRAGFMTGQVLFIDGGLSIGAAQA